MDVVFGADVLTPPDRLVGDDAVIDPAIHLRPRQGIVDGGDLVMVQVVPGLVDIDALLDQSLVVDRFAAPSWQRGSDLLNLDEREIDGPAV